MIPILEIAPNPLTLGPLYVLYKRNAKTLGWYSGQERKVWHNNNSKLRDPDKPVRRLRTSPERLEYMRKYMRDKRAREKREKQI